MVRTKSYGQFCPLAKASDVIAERWTLLILRELLCGSTRFNDLHRGVPLISSSLLSQRLKELEIAGIITRSRDIKSHGHRYQLTDAGRALRPIIELIGAWGHAFVRSSFKEDELDASLLMWDMRRFIRAELFPSGRVVIEFNYSDQPMNQQKWWLVKEQGAVELDLCLHDPGFEIDLKISTELETMTRIWMGDREFVQAIRTGDLKLSGKPQIRSGIHEWLGLSLFARPENQFSLP